MRRADARGQGAATLLAGLMLLLLFAPFLLLTAAMGREDLKAALPGAAMSYLALPYVGLPLLLLVVLREAPRGWIYVLFTFFAVWVGDTAAMYVGKSMGRHKLAPRISPGKTIEGTVASLLFSVGVCCLFAHYLPEIAAALGRAHLLVEKPESLLIAAPALWTRAAVAGGAGGGGDQRGGAAGRPAGVGAEARRGGEGFGNDAAGTWRHSGPDRRAAAGPAGGVCAVHGIWREIRARVGGRVKLDIEGVVSMKHILARCTAILCFSPPCSRLPPKLPTPMPKQRR